LKLSKLVKPVPVLNVDGTRNQEGNITHYVLLTVHVGKHAEKLWCAVTCLGKTPLILSHTWLKRHNPDIDWTTGLVSLSRCPPKCKSLLETCFAKLLCESEAQETWIQAVKSHESKIAIDESTLEDVQKLVPKEYWEYLDVFSKKSSERMCQVQVYSGKGSGQVRTETDEGEGQRLDKGLVRPELGPIGFNDKGIER